MRALANAAWNVFTLATGFVCVATVLAFCGRWWWGFELVCNFRVQYFWLLVVGATGFALRRKWRAVIAVAVFACVNLALIAPLYFPIRAPAAEGRKLRLLIFNVLAFRGDYSTMVEYLRTEKPDIVMLVEVSHACEQAIAVLDGDFPHHFVRPHDGAFGLALLSREHVVEAQFTDVGGFDIKALVARLEIDGTPLTIIGGHPLPPVNPRFLAERNQQLHDYAVLAQQAEGPKMIVGDFNVTGWSSYFTELLRESKLRDSRAGFGVQGSWPVRLPPLRIPIDHCLVSPEIQVHDRRIGPDLGSDHLPVIVEFSLPPTKDAR